MRYVTKSLALFLLATSFANAGDWLTAPSFYTHDPVTGQPTHRYATPPPAVAPQAPSFRESGYSHYRSTLQYGASADNYHRVEQWGPPVQPYGEWRFPYRPYSVPYDMWGAPYAGLNLGFNAYGWQGPQQGWQDPRNSDWQGQRPSVGQGYPSFPPYPSEPYPSGPGFAYPVPPYADGYYPEYDRRPRLDDREFFRKPRPAYPYRENR